VNYKENIFFCIYVLRCESIKRLVASIDLAHLTSQINKSFHIFQEFILLWKLIVLKSICFKKTQMSTEVIMETQTIKAYRMWVIILLLLRKKTY